MEWRDEGIILGARRHGETSVILEVMTRAHGRHMGLVRGGRSRKQQPLLQSGNHVDLIWRARLDEHLGMFQVEPLALNAARLMDSAVAIFGLQTLAAHLRLLPERDAHSGLYETLSIVLDHLEQPEVAAVLIVRFELMVLEELGFGLDLTECAVTGQRSELAYVSPKSGRAVCAEAGEPWRDKLFELPAFMRSQAREAADIAALDAAFRLTSHFFARHVYEPRGMNVPESRAAFLTAVRRFIRREPERGAAQALP